MIVLIAMAYNVSKGRDLSPAAMFVAASELAFEFIAVLAFTH